LSKTQNCQKLKKNFDLPYNCFQLINRKPAQNHYVSATCSSLRILCVRRIHGIEIDITPVAINGGRSVDRKQLDSPSEACRQVQNKKRAVDSIPIVSPTILARAVAVVVCKLTMPLSVSVVAMTLCEQLVRARSHDTRSQSSSSLYIYLGLSKQICHQEK
jgi:hypothetical protein